MSCANRTYLTLQFKRTPLVRSSLIGRPGLLYDYLNDEITSQIQ